MTCNKSLTDWLMFNVHRLEPSKADLVSILSPDYTNKRHQPRVTEDVISSEQYFTYMYDENEFTKINRLGKKMGLWAEVYIE